MISHSDTDTETVAPGGSWQAPQACAAPLAPPLAPVRPFAPPAAPVPARPVDNQPVDNQPVDDQPVANQPAAATAATVLDEMTGVFSGARGALLASVDGFALARSDTMPNEASHAAMLAAAVGLAHQLVLMSGGEQLEQLVVDHDDGSLFLWPIGAARVLAVLTDADVDQGGLRRFVRSRAALLTGTS